jgi:hypothetical protein
MIIFLFAFQNEDSEALQASSPTIFFSLPAWILALDDRPAPHLRWRLTLLVVWGSSLDQPFIGEPLASHAINEAIKPHKGMVPDITFVQTERKLINVAAKMLTAGVVVDANQTALEDGKNAFNPVRGDGTAHIFTSAVIDSFVPKDCALMPS